ncbi:hypothetical protein [Ketobacter sp.]
MPWDFRQANGHLIWLFGFLFRIRAQRRTNMTHPYGAPFQNGSI